MSEDDNMTSEAWQLLEVVRQAESPSKLDMRRIRRAIAVGAAATVAAPVVAKAATVTTTATASQSAAAVTAGKGVALIAAAKGVAAIAVLASVGVGAAWWSGHRSPQPVGGAPAARSAEMKLETPPPSTLLEELTLLQRAQRALAAGTPREALSLAGEHATRYPRSQLSRERDAVRVFAYCALGRLSEARALSAEILKSSPRSPLRTSLEQSCAAPLPEP